MDTSQGPKSSFFRTLKQGFLENFEKTVNWNFGKKINNGELLWKKISPKFAKIKREKGQSF